MFNLDIQIFAIYDDSEKTDYFHYNKSKKIDDDIPIELVKTKEEFANKKTVDLESFKIKYGNNKEYVLAFVKQNGLDLKYASDELKNDKEVVLSAVQFFDGKEKLELIIKKY